MLTSRSSVVASWSRRASISNACSAASTNRRAPSAKNRQHTNGRIARVHDTHFRDLEQRESVVVTPE
jgi:hypothetical protein